MNLKQHLLASVKVEKLEGIFDVPVFVRHLSGRDRAHLMRLSEELPPERKPEVMTWLALFALCDEDGKALFTDDEFSQVHELPAVALDKLAKAIADMNGLSAAALDEQKKSLQAK